MGVFVHSTAVCEEGAQLGAGTHVWHFCHVMKGARIGVDCNLGMGCFVADGAVVGDRVRLQNHVSVFSGVVLENDVFCGPGVVFTNVRRPRAFALQQGRFDATLVQVGATLGANCTICPGTRVGRYALVGAGAVVTRDVPAFAEVVGAPARFKGWVSRRGQSLRFDGDLARCPLTEEIYRRKQLGDGELVEWVAPGAD